MKEMKIGRKLAQEERNSKEERGRDSEREERRLKEGDIVRHGSGCYELHEPWRLRKTVEEVLLKLEDVLKRPAPNDILA